VANSAEHGESDVRALERGTRELLHIACSPHTRSIGGAPSPAEAIRPTPGWDSGPHHSPDFWLVRATRAAARERFTDDTYGAPQLNRKGT
jgi:hypothetical protein